MLKESADRDDTDNGHGQSQPMPISPRRDHSVLRKMQLAVGETAEVDRVEGFAMLLVGTEQLTPGMVAASPIPHPRRAATHLVERGVWLTDPIIRRIRDFSIQRVWIKHPLLKDLDDMVLSRIPEKRREIYDTIKEGFDQLQSRAITTADYRRYCGVISSLIAELLSKDARVGDLTERLFHEGDELASHCANVAYLAITVAMHLENHIVQERRRTPLEVVSRELTSLGVGAMLHDLGKLDSPTELRSQHETTEDRHPLYADHAQAGFRMLRHRINAVASTIALHHHQRWDGTGWPDMDELTAGRFTGGLDGRRIHIFTRIVTVANLFDSLTSLADGSHHPAVRTMHTIQGDEFTGRFDPIVLEAFLQYLPPFPTGTEVTLSNSLRAAVIGMNPDQPCRPTVRILSEWSDAQDIDLATRPDLFIKEALGQDVTRWLYELPSKRQDQRAPALQKAR